MARLYPSAVSTVDRISRGTTSPSTLFRICAQVTTAPCGWICMNPRHISTDRGPDRTTRAESIPTIRVDGEKYAFRRVLAYETHTRTGKHSHPGSGYSVVFGCPVPAYAIQQVRRSSSMRYQILPPPVTSYCHRSKAVPFHVADPSAPFSRCCLSGLADDLGSDRIASNARRGLADACCASWSQPVQASVVAKRISNSPPTAGGAARSPRFGLTGKAPRSPAPGPGRDRLPARG